MGYLSTVGDILMPAGPHNGKTDPANIFGSPGKVLLGTPPSIDERTLSLLSPEQQQLLKFITPYLTGSFGQDSQLNQTEGTSLAALEELALSGVRGEGPTGAAGGALTDILSRGPTDINDFFNTSVRDPMLEEFEQTILPDIGKRFAGEFFSGERQQAERSARDDLLSSLFRERARVALEGRRQDDQSTLQAADAATNRDQGILNLLSTLFTAGGASRGFQQQQIENILAALGLSTQENVVTVNPGSEGLLSSFLGGGGGGAIGGLIGGLFSSEDFKVDKHDAEDVLPLIENLRIERWRYDDRFADDAEHIGPYAEEFHEAFGTESSETIPIVDALGVALKGVQELSQKVGALESALMEG